MIAMALYSESNLHEPADGWTVARRHSGFKRGNARFYEHSTFGVTAVVIELKGLM